MSSASPRRKGKPEPATMGHAKEITRLRRVRGQLDGIEKMINEHRYCMDILQQVKAARSALQAMESSILKAHLEGCVREAFNAKDALAAGHKIQEISDFLNR